MRSAGDVFLWKLAGITAVVVALSLVCERLQQWQHVYGMSLFVALFVLITAYWGRFAGITSVIIAVPTIAFVQLEGDGFAVNRPDEAAKLVTLLFSGALVVCVVGHLRNRMLAAQGQLAQRDDIIRDTRKDRDRTACLLEELTHRVGNDLSTLSAIAGLLAAKAPVEGAAPLNRMRDRIHVFSSLYRRLAATANGTAFNTQDFIKSVCHDLSKAHFGLKPIALTVKADDIQLTPQRAVLLGIVINEAITNCIKYAFPEDKGGKIEVVFERDLMNSRIVCLSVSDDGVGPAAASQPTTGTSSGMGGRIVEAMTAQLNGSYTFVRKEGLTVAKVCFPVE